MNSNRSYCPETLNSDQNQRGFLSRVTLKIDGCPWKTIGGFIYATLSFVHHFKAIGEFKLDLQSRNAQFGSKSAIFLSRVTLKFDGWPWKTIGHLFYLCHFKLCTSFHSHRWIKTKVTVRKRSIRVKISDLLSRVTFKFNGWPWKTIGHLFYSASSFMHHSVAIGEFKLKLQSGNAQFGSKLAIFFPCDLEIWWMTLKNNRAPLLC